MIGGGALLRDWGVKDLGTPRFYTKTTGIQLHEPNEYVEQSKQEG